MVQKLFKEKADWDHYKKHKERLDGDVQKVLEAGIMQNIGVPPGLPSEIWARHCVIVLDKHPELASELHNKKPMTGSEKRKHKRFDPKARPDEFKTYELTEAKDGITADRQFRVIQNEDYTPPPSAPYIKNGKRMEPGFQPFMQLPDGPLPSIENGGTKVSDATNNEAECTTES